MTKTSKISYFLVSIIFFIAFDIYFSNIMMSCVETMPSNPVFDLIFIQNTGAAFSMFSDKTTVLTIITSLLIVGCIYVVIKDLFKSTLVNWALVLCIGGGVGNMIDRIRLNYVVDFIECKLFEFPVFNVADIYVVVSVFCLAILILFYYKEEELDDILKVGKK